MACAVDLVVAVRAAYSQDNPISEALTIYIDIPSHLSLVLEHTKQLSLSAIAHTLLLYQLVRDIGVISTVPASPRPDRRTQKMQLRFTP